MVLISLSPATHPATRNSSEYEVKPFVQASNTTLRQVPKHLKSISNSIEAEVSLFPAAPATQQSETVVFKTRSGLLQISFTTTS